MVLLSQFWTPCFWYGNIKQAVSTIALYTVMGSIVFMVYTVYVMKGGESNQFYMPYFETDNLTCYIYLFNTFCMTSLQIYGGAAHFFFLLFFVSSILVVYGVKTEIRGLLLPWLVGMSCIIIYQLIIGFRWLSAYYIYLESIFILICMWTWMSYHIYCWIAVFSYYQIIRDKQNPRIIVDEDISNERSFHWDETV